MNSVCNRAQFYSRGNKGQEVPTMEGLLASQEGCRKREILWIPKGRDCCDLRKLAPSDENDLVDSSSLDSEEKNVLYL